MSDPAFDARPEPLADQPDPGAPDCLRFYRALAASVTVVTAQGPDGPVGMTASSVTSVSLRPPLVLVCVAGDAATLGAIRVNRAFAVHVLREDQEALATTFALRGAAKFEGLGTRRLLSVPVVANVLGWVVCLLEDERRYGDHSVVIGRIVASQVGSGRPLLWHDSTFVKLPVAERRITPARTDAPPLLPRFDPASTTRCEAVLP